MNLKTQFIELSYGPDVERLRVWADSWPQAIWRDAGCPWQQVTSSSMCGYSEQGSVWAPAVHTVYTETQTLLAFLQRHVALSKVSLFILRLERILSFIQESIGFVHVHWLQWSVWFVLVSLCLRACFLIDKIDTHEVLWISVVSKSSYLERFRSKNHKVF